MNDVKKQMGLRVRKKREELGLTRDQLSELVEMSTDFISEIERGVKGMSAETVLKMCKGLSLTADYIITGKDNSPSDISSIVASLENVDEKYLPLAEELLKVFLKTIAMNGKEDATGG